MYLKTLRVETATEVIREVAFRRGLNLIVDITPPEQRHKSGNNIGKTTALRCVDYCLEGSEEALYMDKEWKEPNEKVQKFLERTRPKFSLILEDGKNHQHVVVRQFGEKTRYLDGEEFAPKAMESALRSLLFRFKGTKPTLRQALGKFVRLTVEAKSNVLHWVPFGKDDDYDVLWLTLFGSAQTVVLDRRRKAQSRLEKLKRQRLEIDRTAASPRQAGKVIEKDLARAKEQLTALSLVDVHENNLARLAQIRERIGGLNRLSAEADAQVSNIERTLRQLGEAIPRIDSGTIREIYESAERFVGELHASYLQLEQFHAAMLKNKARFAEKNLVGWQKKREEVRRELQSLLVEESKLLRAFSSPDVLADVRLLNDQIARLSEQRGYLKGLETELGQLRKQIEEVTQEIAEADLAIESDQETLETQLELFNEFFSEYTQRLLKQSLYLALPFEISGKKDRRHVVPRIRNTEGNEGSGAKKAQIAVFDLAFLKFQEKLRAKSVRFTLHDELELIHGNQLGTLFELADEIDGQFVVPLLSDRVTAASFPAADDCTILRLSSDDKFFGIDTPDPSEQRKATRYSQKK